MYLTTVRRPPAAPAPPEGDPRRRSRRVLHGNVVALGTVSLLTDVSAEMVTAVLPLYLVVGLHLGPLAYGAVDGLYTGATALLRLAGGYVADRLRLRKAVAGVGYGLSAAAKVGFLAVGSSAAAIGAVVTVDWAGKGLRTAPRDALIAASVPEEDLGRAFGLHRAMDSAGAFLGPLAALAVLAVAGRRFDAVFVVSFCVAVLGLVVLALFVREPRERRPAGSPPASPRAVLRLIRTREVDRLLVAAACLGLATIGDGFVYLLLQRKEQLALGWFPLLAVGTGLSYLLLAAPLGALADRVGRLRVVLGGYGLLVAVYLLLATPLHGTPYLVLVLGLYGAFYAATDGVLMALAGPALPAALRTTGFAAIQTAQALAYVASSVLFGLAWQVWGATTAVLAAAFAVLPATFAAVALLGRGRKEEAG